ncbi:MAG: hypothetical protein AB4352_29385 [Hormoscilla sp.]
MTIVKRPLCTALLLLGLWGCGKEAPDIKLTNISDIPQIAKGTTTVYLKGTVIEQVPLLDAQLYQLEDASGKMWVSTTSSLPELGDEITIAGEIRYESIPVEGLDFSEVYIWETQKLEQADREEKTSNEKSTG